MKKIYPPYHVHFYQKDFTSFPIVSKGFDNLEDLYKYAATHYLGYKYRFFGWDNKDTRKGYYTCWYEDLQLSLF